MRTVGWLALTSLLVLVGCQPVREDRHVNFSKDGKQVGFQHGQEGVFVAREDGKGLEKVFKPGPNVLAVSSPLWSPTDKRLIFATAETPDGTPAPQQNPLDQNAAGNWHSQQAVKYTCWLRDPPKNGVVPPPQALFQTQCNHVGYIAANLVIRWHPTGKSVLFLRTVTEDKIGLFEFDLATRTSQRIFSQQADALLFDWTPDGSHLVCVTGNKGVISSKINYCIWIGKPGKEAWREITLSANFPEGSFPSMIEQLRAIRPAWTKDCSHFAFVDHRRQFELCIGNLVERSMQEFDQGNSAIHDLCWSPDGKRLGFVEDAETPGLVLHSLVLPGRVRIDIQRLRQFLGWDASGTHWAYLTDDGVIGAEPDNWALLLVARTQSKNVLYIQPEGQAATPVLSGIRITFAQWSPTEQKLSAWLTFEPTHTWLLPQPWHLPPGDPAVTFDPKTKEIHWLAVNPHEMFHIAHYFHRKKEYPRAWTWYEKAATAALEPMFDSKRTHAENLAQLRDRLLFPSLCLAKMGRQQEADRKLAEFQTAFRALWKSQPPVAAWSILPEVGEAWQAAAWDMCLTEVFLSLDAIEDGCTYLRQELAKARTDEERTTKAAMLAQLLLLQRRHHAYAELALAELLPLINRVIAPGNQRGDARGDWRYLLLQLSLLPLFTEEFLATIPSEQLLPLCQRWEDWRREHPQDAMLPHLDQFFVLAYRRLHRDEELQRAELRLRQERRTTSPFQPDQVKGELQQYRELRRQLPELWKLLGQE